MTRGVEKTTTIGLAIMVVFIAELLVYTWCRVQCRNASYELERAGHVHRQLKQTEHRLQTELASLRMPQRIEAEAAKRLGLQRPNPEQVTRLP